jgi:hypothetical protein
MKEKIKHDYHAFKMNKYTSDLSQDQVHQHSWVAPENLMPNTLSAAVLMKMNPHLTTILERRLFQAYVTTRVC